MNIKQALLSRDINRILRSALAAASGTAAYYYSSQTIINEVSFKVSHLAGKPTGRRNEISIDNGDDLLSRGFRGACLRKEGEPVFNQNINGIATLIIPVIAGKDRLVVRGMVVIEKPGDKYGSLNNSFPSPAAKMATHIIKTWSPFFTGNKHELEHLCQNILSDPLKLSGVLSPLSQLWLEKIDNYEQAAETSTHVRRVTDIHMKLIDAISNDGYVFAPITINEGMRALQEQAALLHDSGKDKVPMSILRPGIIGPEDKGGLNEKERKEMELHPEGTYNLLNLPGVLPGSDGFDLMSEVRDTAASHHRLPKASGKIGYPGKEFYPGNAEMPFASEIMAVADQFAAMAIDSRSYRPQPITIERTLRNMFEDAQAHRINPQVFRLLVAENIGPDYAFSQKHINGGQADRIKVALIKEEIMAVIKPRPIDFIKENLSLFTLNGKGHQKS